MFISIDGFSGGVTALNTRTNTDAVELAKTLLEAGYGVKVNAIRVGLEFGPGYNQVIWSEGDFEGKSLQ